MKTRLAALASAATLGALAGASGCADNRASVQVQMICVPTEDCTFARTCETEFAGYPTYDRTGGSGGGLILFLQVANQVPSNGDLSAGRVNTNDAHVDEIAVTVTGAAAADYAIGGNGLIPAGGSAVVAVPVALPGFGTGEALAKIRLRGYYDHGARFETGEFPVTISICSGCLGTACPPTTADPNPTTCPEGGEGQRPLTCGEAATTTP
jgi:hypothetical protein